MVHSYGSCNLFNISTRCFTKCTYGIDAANPLGKECIGCLEMETRKQMQRATFCLNAYGPTGNQYTKTTADKLYNLGNLGAGFSLFHKASLCMQVLWQVFIISVRIKCFYSYHMHIFPRCHNTDARGFMSFKNILPTLNS